jgi:hypothetical protein
MLYIGSFVQTNKQDINSFTIYHFVTMSKKIGTTVVTTTTTYKTEKCAKAQEEMGEITKRPNKCGLCGKREGHNKRGCPENPLNKAKASKREKNDEGHNPFGNVSPSMELTFGAPHCVAQTSVSSEKEEHEGFAESDYYDEDSLDKKVRKCIQRTPFKKRKNHPGKPVDEESASSHNFFFYFLFLFLFLFLFFFLFDTHTRVNSVHVSIKAHCKKKDCPDKNNNSIHC